jgi:hypothetical protein
MSHYLDSPRLAGTLTRDTETALGILADSRDGYDLMRAIARCDELVTHIRQVQLIHSQNLCRVANHLAADLATLKEEYTS